MTGMTVVAWSGLLVLAIVSTAQAALFPAKTPVVDLTQSNFQKEVVQIEKPAIVMFSAPWCGHCKNLAPHFHKAASSLDGIVKFGNIDCDADLNKGLCAQYQIQGFPTIKLFPATKKRLPRDYRGERTAPALIEFAKDTLPQGARKIPPSELEKYIEENPTRPKVILFSNKPKSSPLYRSLALDYRKTMDFGFMRGDESLARSSARLTLGVDIPTADDLPVLIVVPGRKENSEGEGVPLEKGNFETYSGQLKYWKIKAWLDEIGPKVGISKSQAKRPPPQKKKKPAQKSKYADEQIPEGGTVEWKANKLKEQDQTANMVKEAIERYEEKEAAAAEAPDAPIMDESKPQKDSFQGQMLDIERAGQIAEDIHRQQQAAARKREGQYVEMPESSRLGVEEEEEEVVPQGSLFEKAKQVVGAASESLAQAVKGAGDSINEQIEAVKSSDTIEKAKGSAQKVFQSGAEAISGSTKGPFDVKSRALMKQFGKWMSGENAGWEEQVGEEFEKAQLEAEKLLATDPEEARRQAWESEEWLLKEMKGDRDRMMKVMTDEQKAQVENMIELIETRLKEKGTRDVFERVLDNVIGEEKEDSTSSKEEARGKSHDEL